MKHLYFFSLFIIILFSNEKINGQSYQMAILDDFGITAAYPPASCFVDINNDGYIDFWNGGKIFLQDSTGVFAGNKFEHDFTGITVFADFDNDGYPDALSRQSNSIHLFKNSGPPSFKFINIDSSCGLGLNMEEKQIIDIAWLDINNDGLLDFYISSYEYPPENSAIGHEDYLYINDGSGKFIDHSIASNIASEIRCSRGISILDFNNDGWQDIYVSAYRLEPNVLWENQGNNSFINVADSLGVLGTKIANKYGHTISTAVADIDGNGFLDLFAPITHHRNAPGDLNNHLWLNTGDPNFEFYDFKNHEIYNAEIGANPSLVDLNNDGELDVFFINLYGQPGPRFFIYHNNGGVFTEQVDSSSLPKKYNAEFAHFIDINRDGFLDFYAPNSQDETRQLFISDTVNNNSYLSILLEGNANLGSNTTALGSRVKLWLDGQMQMRELNCNNGNGYGSIFNPLIHFGLGKKTSVDSIEIKWPSGQIEKYYDIEANHHLKFIESIGYRVKY